jgi:hypothetical protein
MLNSAAMGTAPASEPVSANPFRGIIDVFSHPAELFQRVKERPSVFVPYPLFLVVMALIMYLITDIIIEEQIRSPQFKEQAAQMAEQGQTYTPEMARKIMKVTTPVFGTSTIALIPIFAAALALFWGNFVWAGRATFAQLMSVMSYASLIHGLGALAVLPLVFATDSVLVGYSLASLVPDKMDNIVLYTALSKIDIFIIWEIIVVGIGMSIIYNVSRNKGLLISVLSMGMLSVVYVVITAISVLAK